VKFTLIVSGGNAPLCWTWDFGDGTPVDHTQGEVVHQYMTAGDFTASLTVVDLNNDITSDTESITVLDLVLIGVVSGITMYWLASGVYGIIALFCANPSPNPIDVIAGIVVAVTVVFVVASVIVDAIRNKDLQERKAEFVGMGIALIITGIVSLALANIPGITEYLAGWLCPLPQAKLKRQLAPLEVPPDLARKFPRNSPWEVCSRPC